MSVVCSSRDGLLCHVGKVDYFNLTLSCVASCSYRIRAMSYKVEVLPLGRREAISFETAGLAVYQVAVPG